MSDLIAKLERATEPSRDLDEEIAITVGLWKSWLSKHRRWNFNGPDGKSFSWPDSIPAFDSETGKKIELTELPWSGWAEEARLPEWTGSIDAAQTLVPQCDWWRVMGKGRTIAICIGEVAMPATDHWDGMISGNGATPALALCVAALKANATHR